VCGSSYDVAIVGAGPGGANSAYMLRDSGLDIAVFEYSDRVGGRLFTYQLPNTPDVNLEIGGMRFIEGAMHRLWKVISELGKVGRQPPGYAQLVTVTLLISGTCWNLYLTKSRDTYFTWQEN